MGRSIFLSIFLGFSLAVVVGQPIHLDVMLGDKKIGDIDATAKKNAKETVYEMTNKVQVKLLFDVLVEGRTNAVFKEGKLWYSKAFRSTNMASENKETTVQWEGKNYNIIGLADQAPAIAAPITFSLINLYYKEPVGQSQVFSEAQGQYLPLAALPNHQYQLQVNSGKKDLYTYANGKLVQVETTIAMRTVLFVVR